MSETDRTHLGRDRLVVRVLHDGAVDDVVLRRPEDLLALDHVAFAPLFRSLSVATIAALVVALLLERRVILASASLATLSQCTHALLALLYPFEWQLVLIPILPRRLLDYCCSPTPFLIGVLADALPTVERLPLSEVRCTWALHRCATTRTEQMSVRWATHRR
jgi:DENN domain-containing protein 2